ncbi:hypothetical protein L204_103116 [Cryptococcus depauperatus]|nr:hypothetical protein L204_00139 [Cryptococcus depauperatus CBS 7855]
MRFVLSTISFLSLLSLAQAISLGRFRLNLPDTHNRAEKLTLRQGDDATELERYAFGMDLPPDFASTGELPVITMDTAGIAKRAVDVDCPDEVSPDTSAPTSTAQPNVNTLANNDEDCVGEDGLTSKASQPTSSANHPTKSTTPDEDDCPDDGNNSEGATPTSSVVQLNTMGGGQKEDDCPEDEDHSTSTSATPTSLAAHVHATGGHGNEQGDDDCPGDEDDSEGATPTSLAVQHHVIGGGQGEDDCPDDQNSSSSQTSKPNTSHSQPQPTGSDGGDEECSEDEDETAPGTQPTSTSVNSVSTIGINDNDECPENEDSGAAKPSAQPKATRDIPEVIAAVTEGSVSENQSANSLKTVVHRKPSLVTKTASVEVQTSWPTVFESGTSLYLPSLEFWRHQQKIRIDR